MNDENIPYRQRLALIRQGLAPKTTGAKPKKPIPKKSQKKIAEEKEQKLAGTDSEMDMFFEAMRKRMVGVCFFCGGKTEKDNDETYRRSIAHLYPKRSLNQGGFPSVGTHEENWVELCHYGNSCHQNFDSGMISWEFIKDSKEWLTIRAKLIDIMPFIAPEERKNKLYDRLVKLVYDRST